MRIRSSLPAAMLSAALLFAQEQIPSLAPVVRSVYPAGARLSSAVEVELAGQNLDGARSLVFAGSGLEAAILSSSAGRIRARVQVSAEAETGVRDFRLITAGGSYVGVFHVGSIPEVAEQEPNDTARRPQSIALPAIVNGIVGAEDFDHFRFTAAEGETISFDVIATRNGSRFDANLAILDSKGRELAWDDDHYIFGDPRLTFRFDKAGDYLVRVGSLAGNPSACYRLAAGRIPYVSHTLPAGLRRGALTEVTIRGSHLGDTSAVWLGDRLARGRILSKSDGELRVSFETPSSAALGRHQLHLESPVGEMPYPASLVVGDYEEVTVSGAPSSPGKALPVKVPVVLNGSIAEPKGSHYFTVQAKAGDYFEFQAQSMRLGYHLDPVITVLDGDGNRLAAADDPGIDERSDEFQLDPRLGYRFEKTGTYLVAVRDAMYRGGDDFVYRLSIAPAEPHFLVELREPLKTAYVGNSVELLLRVRRRGGWDQPVEVWAEGLPPGVAVEKVVVPAKDSIVKDTCGVDRVVDGTLTYLPLQVNGASPGLYSFTVKARGVMNGRTVERTAEAHYVHNATGYAYGKMQVQRSDLTVLPAPKVMLSGPEQLTVAAGGRAEIQVTLRRFGKASEKDLVLKAKDLPAGATMEPIRVPAGSKQATLPVQVSEAAAQGEAPVVISAETADTGEVFGESPTILLRIGGKTDRKR